MIYNKKISKPINENWRRSCSSLFGNRIEKPMINKNLTRMSPRIDRAMRLLFNINATTFGFASWRSIFDER